MIEISIMTETLGFDVQKNLQVVVTFPNCDKGGNDVIPWGVFVVKGSLSEPVSQRVHTESRVVNKQQSSGPSVEKSTSPISPSKSSDESGEEESHTEDQRQIPTMLPSDDLIAR
jgi:hypothetical protein